MTAPQASSLLLCVSVFASSLLACSGDGMDGSGTGGTATGGASTGGASSGGDTSSGGAVSSGGTASGGGGATGGTAGTGGGAGQGGDPTLPPDTSKTGLETWLAAKSYQSPPWVGDAEPRTTMASSNPHGSSVRAYYNPTAMASIMAGRNDLAIGDVPGNDVGSMSVKEFYDDTGAVEGIALFLRTATDAGMADWLYYCKSASGLCSNPAVTDSYGAGAFECSACHGGVFYSEFVTAAQP